MPALFFFLCAFLIGALPVTYWIGRIFYGIHAGDYGPGSIGPVKLLRLAEPEAFFLALLGELSKGCLLAHGAELCALDDPVIWWGLFWLSLGHRLSPVLGGHNSDLWLAWTGYIVFFVPVLGQLSLATACALFILTKRQWISATAALAVTAVTAALLGYSSAALLVLAGCLGLQMGQNRKFCRHIHRPAEIE
ncbi:glycerol-3-phosphate acyltransferase [Heliophilum fasciatum]|uniref:Glycerol-3-phosphate acyltransferase PlsY n=1 Tax=Heliophilum fasciatum TaxID=35700 RepID=A0A4R2RH24_9FIRM|nr:glycerol-3-phosphate acyltransferase [Heliophilum fasciatum]MCW2278931.1 glycerol-3-phosphate acyltransferase PlsY [Heliophilum fasciatum]TCP62064.1 glycerol-3-phosphate acyltransferase PlsY [Heliophilum fasciatum]